MQPRHSRDTVTPVRPRKVYFIVPFYLLLSESVQYFAFNQETVYGTFATKRDSFLRCRHSLSQKLTKVNVGSFYEILRRINPIALVLRFIVVHPKYGCLLR